MVSWANLNAYKIILNWQPFMNRFYSYLFQYFIDQAGIVRKVDNAIHQIYHYSVDSVVCFVNTYPLDNNLSSGKCYPAFEQLFQKSFPIILPFY